MKEHHKITITKSKECKVYLIQKNCDATINQITLYSKYNITIQILYDSAGPQVGI